MRIAVVIPCHNAEAWLGQTLGCLLDQTLVPEQIVVVDDGSTDGSRAVAEALAAQATSEADEQAPRKPRFTLIHADEPGSASRARNLGYSRVGDGIEAVMFLDADDVLSPEVMQGLAEALNSGTPATEPREQRTAGRGVALGPWVRLERGDGGRWASRPRSAPDRPAGVTPIDGWLTGWYHPPCAVLWDRETYDQTGGWDPAWCPNDDGDLMLRALVDGAAVRVASRGCSYYRVLPGDQVSLSGRRGTAEGLAARLRVFKKIALRIEQAGRMDHHRDALAEAAWTIRREASGPAPEVAARAEALGRRWERSRWQRLRPGTIKPTAAYPDAPPPFESEEITYGIESFKKLSLDDSVSETARPRFTAAPNRPRVSVIMPTYNRPAETERAIRSVLDQSFADFELLVIDDASTDETAERSAAIADPRLEVIRLSNNGGVARARNVGLRRAKGSYLACLDSDDRWLPDKLARQVERLDQAEDDVAMIYCGMKIQREAGSEEIVEPAWRGDLEETMLRQNVIQPGGSGPLMRRQVLAGIGFFDPELPAIEDWDYWLRVAQLYRIDVVSEPLCIYDDTQPDGEDRRSRHVRRNLDAREMFFVKHRAALRRHGAALGFLRETVERCLRPKVIDPATARRLAWRMMRERPGDPTAWRTFKWAWTERTNPSGRPTRCAS